MNVWDTTAVKVSMAADSGAALSDAVKLRKNILIMTETAEKAVLEPADPGGWSHDLRAALAVRIALLNDCPALATHYRAAIGSTNLTVVADPTSQNVPDELKHCIPFVDSVATEPANITEADIRSLQDAGVADADIVRLSELNAFLAYQIRLVAGLSLMTETEA